MKRWLLLGLCWLATNGCGGSVAEDEATERVERAVTLQQARAGLSLLFRNGVAPAKVLVGNTPRFIQEIDLVESVPSATDQGIQPLLTSSRTAALDWDGVEQVEEIWVPAP